MNYIGSKYLLMPFLIETIAAVAGTDTHLSFADLFAGTGVVGKTFKEKGHGVIANDIQYYSYILNHTGYFAICGARGCIRACMDMLEKSGRIENRFHNRFYKKKSWLLPNKPETVSRGVNPFREAYLDEKYPGIRAGEYEKPGEE